MLKDNVLVSVIVPIYGTESYLPNCIESICNQTYSNLQIILVDDESQDRCPEICDEYAKIDSRIKVIHQNNKGISGARNTGLSYATGAYIMFVDSDDELLPNAIEILLGDVYQYGADIVCALSETVNEEGQIVETYDEGECEIFQGDESLLLSLNEDFRTAVVWAKIYKTDFLKGIKFEEGKNFTEDSYYLFQCCVRKPLFVYHEIVVYRQNIRRCSSSRLKFSDNTLSILYFFEQKKKIIVTQYPQYIDKLYHLEVCANLRLLSAILSTSDEKYKELQKRCIKTVRRLYSHYMPINDYHKKLFRIVIFGLYPIYKKLVRYKYYR